MLQAKDLLHPAWKPSAGSPQGKNMQTGLCPLEMYPFMLKRAVKKWESFLHSPFSLTTCSLSIS